LFVAQYGVLAAGAEICLRLVPTSQTGLRRGALLVTGFCAGISAVQTGTDDRRGRGSSASRVA